MTALSTYLRLEAIGLWREHPEATPREVVTSFGTTTLVLTDLGERPLGHWALAGIEMLGATPDGARIFSVSSDGGETLEIHDPDMIAAITAVSRAVALRPLDLPPRRRRLPLVPIALVGALMAAAAVAGPELLATQVARLMPPEQAAETGDRLLITLIAEGGVPCPAVEGSRVLAALAASLGDPPPRLRVLDLAGAPAAALPGGTILIDRGTLATTDDPRDILAAAAAAQAADPVAAVFRAAGLGPTLRYLLTGRIGDTALVEAAKHLSATASGPAASTPDPDPSIPQPDWAAFRASCP